MKKIKLLAILPFCLSLFSCSENSSNSPLIISEFYSDSDNFNDRFIELYNLSNKTIDLSKYSINIYRGSSNEVRVYIPLEGNLESKQTYVISDSLANEEILAKTDLLFPSLLFDGSWPVALKKKSKSVDVLGTIGFGNEYGKNLDMVRKVDHFIGRKIFQPYDWCRYSRGDFSHLKNVDNTLSDEKLLEGPHLTSEDFSKPFAKNNLTGGGGAVRVTLSSLGDGDTTYFKFPDFIENCEIRGSFSTRYLCVDTPEVSHGNGGAQPWGNKAKQFNNAILRNAKSFAVSTAEDYMLNETFGRLMGFVWYSEKENALPEEFNLLNFMIVKEGYSTFRFIGSSQEKDKQTYNGISYSNYMYNAELLARSKNLKVHGEVDPDFK